MKTLFPGRPSIQNMQDAIVRNHYTHSIPTGRLFWYYFEPAIILFSIPANPYIASFLFGIENGTVLELARLWAPDGHAKNLLTQAIAFGVNSLRKDNPEVQGLVSYADPNVGHSGFVYRAASWLYTGQVEESRYYRHADTGQVVARRAFHSNEETLTKAEIEARGYTEESAPGRHRFVRILNRRLKLKIPVVNWKAQ